MDLLENEQIKDIENYEGLYAVTTKGKVKNPKWITTGRAKSPTTNEIIEI